MKVAIILGAGVSGLTAAISLKSIGYRIILVEKQKISANMGGGIDIQPNGTKVLFSLGLEDALKKITVFNHRKISISSNDGRTLCEIPLENFEKDSRYPLLSFFRGDLLRALFDAAQPHEVYEGIGCKDVRWDAQGVSVLLDNSEKLVGDILIGADGINSIVRRKMLPKVEKAYLGHISLGGVVSKKYFTHNYIHGLQRTCVVFPCTEHYCHTVMFLPKPQGWLRKNTDNFEDQKKLFVGWSKEVDQILNHLEEKNRFCVESHEVPPLERFAEGRAFLVGDSAHAMSPLGALATSLALEDVEGLISALVDNTCFDDAAEMYNKARLPRAAELRDYSHNNLIPGIISHGPEDFAKRITRLSTLPPEQVLAPLGRVLQSRMETMEASTV